MDISPIINSGAYKTRLGSDNDEVIIGDSKSIDFKPQIKFTKWNKENSLTIKVPDGLIASTTPTLTAGKLEVKDSKVGFYFNPDPDNADNFKFGLILYEKPTTNTWSFQLVGWEEFDFLASQPPDLGGMSKDLEGSWIVFHKEKRNNQYWIGQFGVFYKPKFLDSKGKEEFATLEIKDGVYKITLPQEFIDTAVYPIKANDTFGDTSTGSSYDLTNGLCVCYKATIGEEGDVSKLSIYGRYTDAGAAIKGLIFADDGGDGPGTLLGVTNAASFAVNWEDRWLDLTFGTPVNLPAGDYWLGAIGGVGTSIIQWSPYTNGYAKNDDSNNYTTPTNWVSTDYTESTYGFSIYATYTPSGAATSTTGEVFPTSATTEASAPWSDDTWVRTSQVYDSGGTTLSAACISASTFDSGDQSYLLKCSNFDFSGILAGSEINGVICRMETWALAAVSCAVDHAKLLDTSRDAAGDNMVTAGTTVVFSATTQTLSFGGSANLWGNALSADWVKNANFGVAIGCIAKTADVDVFVDYVTLEVVYTPPAAVAPLSLMYHFIEC